MVRAETNRYSHRHEQPTDETNAQQKHPEDGDRDAGHAEPASTEQPAELLATREVQSAPRSCMRVTEHQPMVPPRHDAAWAAAVAGADSRRGGTRRAVHRAGLEDDPEL